MRSSQKKLSSTSKTRKNNNSTPKNGGWVIVVLIFFVLLVGGIFFFLNASKAELVIALAPSTAKVKIKGREYTNGHYTIRPGVYEVEVFADGLEPKNLQIELKSKEVKSLNVYLLESEGDFSYYLSHEEEISYLRMVGDENAQEFVNKYYQAKAIEEVLPIRISHNQGRKTSTLSIYNGEKCNRSYCLRIVDDNADLKDEMLQKIKEYGYDPDDYEIEYFRTDSLKEGKNE